MYPLEHELCHDLQGLACYLSQSHPLVLPAGLLTTTLIISCYQAAHRCCARCRSDWQ
jgi:hypothetical protein